MPGKSELMTAVSESAAEPAHAFWTAPACGEFEFEIVEQIDTDELISFYDRQHSAVPHGPEKVKRMVDNSFCFVTARKGGELIGIARGITDGVRGYLTECKLDPQYQGPAAVTKKDGRIEHDEYGIASEMANRVIHMLGASGVERIDVLAYGTEVDFCQALGFKKAAGQVPMVFTAGGGDHD